MPNIEKLDEVQIHPQFADHKALIWANLNPKLRSDLVEFLKKRHDSFAWSYEDMTGIDPGLITHELHVDPEYTLVRQKRRKFAPERNQIIDKEI